MVGLGYRISWDTKLNLQIVTLQFFDACYLQFEGLLYLQINQKNVFVQRLKQGSVKVKKVEGCDPIQV